MCKSTKNKFYYIVTFCGFNQRWCEELMGKRYVNPPSYCRVQKLIDNGTFKIIK